MPYQKGNMKWHEKPSRAMQLCFPRFRSYEENSTATDVMLGEEESDHLEPCDQDMKGSSTNLKPCRSSVEPSSHIPMELDRGATGSNANQAEDGAECRCGSMVFSSYCCVVLVIFAFLFILIGSILMYAITRHSDDDVVQFLNKHEYLRAASPLVLCLGMLMLIAGLIFWIIKRCKQTRANEAKTIENTYSNAYFCPESGDPPLSSRGSLGLASRLTSMGSAVSSRAVSPLLAPASAGVVEKPEWKWPPTQPVVAPPLGSFPRNSSSSSPITLDQGVSMKERYLAHQASSTSSESGHGVQIVPVTGIALNSNPSTG